MTDPASEGKRLAKMGDFEGALPHLQQAVRLRPDSPDDWLALGACFFRLDRNDDFREALRKALAIDPDHAPTRRFLRRVTGSDLIPARDVGRDKIFMEEGQPPGQVPPASDPQPKRSSPGCLGFVAMILSAAACFIGW